MRKLVKEKDEAIKLRLSGMSYSQIRQIINVSKSTLSLWLGEYPLSPERINELRGKNLQRIEKFRNSMKIRREKRLSMLFEVAEKRIGQMSDKDLLIAGLCLYWGEGDKSGNVFSVSNTDPDLMRLFMKWARTFSIDERKYRVILHVYSDMNQEKERVYWSDILKLPLENFRKTYIKTSLLSGLTYKKGFNHGTCMVRVYDKRLAEFVLMGIKYMKKFA